MVLLDSAMELMRWTGHKSIDGHGQNISIRSVLVLSRTIGHVVLQCAFRIMKCRPPSGSATSNRFCDVHSLELLIQAGHS